MKNIIGAFFLLAFSVFVFMFSPFTFAQTAPTDTTCPSLKLAGFSLTDDQGVVIGVGIATIFCIAGIFKVLSSPTAGGEE